MRMNTNVNFFWSSIICILSVLPVCNDDVGRLIRGTQGISCARRFAGAPDVIREETQGGRWE